MLDFKIALLSLLPKGPFWKPKKDSDLDLLYDAIAANWQRTYEWLRSLANLRNPDSTPFLSTLEKEFGIYPNDNLTDLARRNYLKAIKYAKPGTSGVSDLQDALDRAGYDLLVVQNNPVVDPLTFLSEEYLMYLGDTNAYLGEPDAMLGKVGGYLIVNSEPLTAAGEIYTIQETYGNWPFVFFICGGKYNWPLHTDTIVSLYKEGAILLLHDYRNDSFEDYSGNDYDGEPTVAITTDTDGALLTNISNEIIEVKDCSPLNVPSSDFSLALQMKGVYTDPNITFQALFNESGIQNLNPDLTINSTTKTPVFRYIGKDASNSDWSYWIYGEDLTAQAGTDNTLNDGFPGLSYYDDSILFGGAGYRYFQATNTAFADITTEDIVIECVFKYNQSAGNKRIFAKQNAGVGFSVRTDITNSLWINIQDGVNSATLIGPSLIDNTWYHCIAFIDKSGSGQLYINSQASGSPVIVSTVGSLTNGLAFTIGADSSGTNIYDSNLVYAAMWKGAAWLNSHLQPAVAQERFCKLLGIWPHYAAGAYAPTTMTRNSVAFLRKYNGSEIELHQVPIDWLRYERVYDGSAMMKGYLQEPQITNQIQESIDYSTWWSVYGIPTINTDVEEAPDKTVTADGLVATTGNSHYVYNAAVSHAAGKVSLSIFAKPGSTAFKCTWIKVWINPTVGATGYARFNIETNVIDDETDCEAYIEGPYHNGYYKCCITIFTTATSSELGIQMVSGVSDIFNGNGSDENLYLWNSQFEENDFASSPILTTGGTATRQADSLVYNPASSIPATGTQSFVLTLFDTLLKNLIVTSETTDNSIVGTILYDKRSEENKGLLISAVNQRINIYHDDDVLISLTELTDSTNYSFISTFDRDGLLKIYLDGTLEQTIMELFSFSLKGTSALLAIGNSNIDINFTSWDEYIATVILFSRVLTALEVSEIHTGFASALDSYTLEQGYVPSEQSENFKRLVLRHKPLSTWCAAIVEVY